MTLLANLQKKKLIFSYQMFNNKEKLKLQSRIRMCFWPCSNEQARSWICIVKYCNNFPNHVPLNNMELEVA
jgi:hypothetical protein